MCDFRIGDEVVCVDASKQRLGGPLVKGRTYTIKLILRNYGLMLMGERNDGIDWRGHNPRRFQKVERRSLTEWLAQSVGNTDKLDKKKVRVK